MNEYEVHMGHIGSLSSRQARRRKHPVGFAPPKAKKKTTTTQRKKRK